MHMYIYIHIYIYIYIYIHGEWGKEGPQGRRRGRYTYAMIRVVCRHFQIHYRYSRPDTNEKLP